MNIILAAPLRGSVSQEEIPSAPGLTAGWRLVERRLLTPPRRDGIECLLRLERADGMREPWQAGDLIELRDPFNPADIEPDLLAATFHGPRHGAVSLLPGGWPAGDWMRRTKADLRIPIASGGHSPTLDLLLLSGIGERPMLDAQTLQHLLLETTINLRILSSPGQRMPSGPLLYFGDFASSSFARAFAQECESEEMMLFIEAASGVGSLPPQTVLSRECCRDGTIIAMPRLETPSDVRQMLNARRKQIHFLLERNASVVVASSAERFGSLIWSGLRTLIGDAEIERIDKEGRLRSLAV